MDTEPNFRGFPVTISDDWLCVIDPSITMQCSRKAIRIKAHTRECNHDIRLHRRFLGCSVLAFWGKLAIKQVWITKSSWKFSGERKWADFLGFEWAWSAGTFHMWLAHYSFLMQPPMKASGLIHHLHYRNSPIYLGLFWLDLREMHRFEVGCGRFHEICTRGIFSEIRRSVQIRKSLKV